MSELQCHFLAFLPESPPRLTKTQRRIIKYTQGCNQTENERFSKTSFSFSFPGQVWIIRRKIKKELWRTRQEISNENIKLIAMLAITRTRRGAATHLGEAPSASQGAST